jgi:hypothetical protein
MAARRRLLHASAQAAAPQQQVPHCIMITSTMPQAAIARSRQNTAYRLLKPRVGEHRAG